MNTKTWFEDDEFWITFASLMFNEDRWAEAPREARLVTSLLNLEPGARILDSCSGVGRHSIELAKLGYTVTGVDRTSVYLDAARDTAEAENLDIEFLLDDVRHFKRSGGFSAIINLFSSFGYFTDIDDEKLYIRNIFDSLAPGGKFLADINGKEIAGRTIKEKDWFEDNGMLVLVEAAIVDDWSRISNRWILCSNAYRFERTFSYRLYSAREITDALLAAGFASVDIYGGIDGRPYDRNADRLVAVGTKSS